MEKATKSSKSKTQTFMRWMRIIHRDLGFLMVGVCLIYGISGFLLNHLDGKDPAYKTQEGTILLDKNLSQEDIPSAWADTKLPRIKKILPADETHYKIMLDGGIAAYNASTGVVDYETFRKNPFIYWINKLHYNKVDGWSIVADIFACSLIFLAISGLFMVRGKHSIRRRGKWYLIAGLLIPILYILFA